VIQKPT